MYIEKGKSDASRRGAYIFQAFDPVHMLGPAEASMGQIAALQEHAEHCQQFLVLSVFARMGCLKLC